MAKKTLGFGLIAGALVALVIGLFITPHEAGAPHVIGFYVLLGAGAIILAGREKTVEKQEAFVPAMAESAPIETPKSLPKAAVIAGVATAGVLATGLAASRDETPASPDDRLLEDLERDLFADLAPIKPEVEISPVVEVELPVEAVSTPEIEAIMPVPEAIAPVAEPVNGLLPDADLAALQAGDDPLAPLDGLDVVGAYDSAGTRFTMYSDGSVTAFGPDLDRRFKSLDALRSFIDKGK